MLAVVHDWERLEFCDTGRRRQLGQSKLLVWTLDEYDLHYVVSFSADGEYIVLETRGGEIKRWETRSLKPLPTLQAFEATPPTYTRGVHWSKDGRTILAALSGVQLSKDGRYILATVT